MFVSFGGAGGDLAQFKSPPEPKTIAIGRRVLVVHIFQFDFVHFWAGVFGADGGVAFARISGYPENLNHAVASSCVVAR